LDDRAVLEPQARNSGFPVSYQAYHLLWLGLDLLLPPRCAGCDKPGSRWCTDCQRQVGTPPEPLCRVCGLPLPAPSGVCSDCRSKPPPFVALRAWSNFEGPIRHALHQLKYRRDIGFAEAVIPQLSTAFRNLRWPVDVVLPVPLSRRRQNQRGYNQAGLIARPLAISLGLKYDPRALTRRMDTRSQVGLSRQARHENVRGAFQAVPGRVRGRRILLLDDVATTGATLSAGALALCAAGASDVYAFTLARAIYHHARTDA
jgi:ComF family protein